MALATRTCLNQVYPARPDAVPHARSDVARLAREAGADPETVESVRLSVSEAFTNAVLHAYRDEPGVVHVTAAAADDEFWVLIADDGCGHQAPPAHPGLGWGLALIAESSDDFLIAERSGGGTEVRMCFPLRSSGVINLSEFRGRRLRTRRSAERR